MFFGVKIKNRFFWLIGKIRKYCNLIYQIFFGVEAKYAQYNILPDKVFLKKLFKHKMGTELDLKKPKTFNEKLQWLKLYDRKPEYTIMVDKYLVKDYVAKVLGDEFVIPTLGVWDRFKDIDFDSLPDKFVLKCTHDSGGVFICKDKNKLNKEELSEFFEKRLAINYYKFNREWPYKNVKPRIIAEEFIETHLGLVDYKFFCFNGEPELLYISIGLDHHPTAKISFYDFKGNEMSFHRKDFKPYHNAQMPDNLNQIKGIAKKLSGNINSPFVRIDMYAVDGRIYFSEITFSPCAGFLPFEPEEWDRKLGDMIGLKNK